MLRLLIMSFVFVVVSEGMAQSSKKKGEVPQASAQPSSLEPLYPEKTYQPRKKKSTGKITYNARDEFYEQIEQVAKAYRKTEKEMRKPQYSDPSYFGHKRPPKRNPPGKMKYCKQCGLRH